MTRRTNMLWAAVAASALYVTACGPSQEEYDAKVAQVADLEAELESSKSALGQRLDELSKQNDELKERLQIAGAEKGDMSEALAKMQRAMDELRQREKQAQARLATFRQMIDKFRSMIDSGKLRVRVVRGRMVVELSENILFDSGKATLKRGGKEALKEVASVLASIGGRDFQITGHTDNIPIRSARFPSNWELSTARAVEVTRFLAEEGVDPTRLSAAGYADTQPVAPNSEATGRAQNRRIEIVLMPNLDELPDLSALADG